MSESSNEVERLEKKIDATNDAIQGLTRRIADLVTALARREEADKHNTKRMDGLEEGLNQHDKRIRDVETAQAGDRAGIKVLQWIIPFGVSVVVAIASKFAG